MKRDIVWTTKFKKDYKLAMKRHMDIGLLDDIIRALSRGEKLPEKNKDHELTGDWVGHRECHIQPDWLLIYRIEDDVLVLTLAPGGQRGFYQSGAYRGGTSVGPPLLPGVAAGQAGRFSFVPWQVTRACRSMLLTSIETQKGGPARNLLRI